ncbi:HVO_A0556 family zinc finger protein [Halosolutus gelatinilyticus]|uniref:HVO_A0556 family zinc finger protein n=1 Tax=Halosolutus gelatinilyticus TaxID=2931975 RepID=UPI002AAF9A4B|nr:HVO_A0556 family zinc finger protein [Halosolutus gelatinilyticus]
MQEIMGTTGREIGILDALAGSDCTFCGAGTLDHDVYKGNNAVVCAECGVPGAQVW